jgi:hypothetical protein
VLSAAPDAREWKPRENMMKRTSQIGTVAAAGALALGALGTVGDVVAADATRPAYNSYRPQRGTARPQRSGPNDNDYHADYHADYRATQDGRPAKAGETEEPVDPRRDSRRFQDGVRAIRSPYDWRR